MKKILLVSSVILLMAAGCNSSQQASAPAPVAQTTNPAPTAPTPTPTTAPASTTPTTPPVQATTALKLGTSSSLGQYLTATNGMTLYTSSGDTANTSNCSGSCATNWPPYTVSSGLNLAMVSGLNGQIGTITRADGTTQVTYNGLPLYFWIHDAKAGDTTGQGIGGFSVAKP